MTNTPESKNTTIIIGGGLTGLSAGYALSSAGWQGMFRYYNMDHAISSGITTAEKVINSRPVFEDTGDGEWDKVLAGNKL